MDVPDFISSADLAARIGCTERMLRRTALKFGCCHVIGRIIFFTEKNVVELLEATKPKPRKSTRTVSVPSEDKAYQSLLAHAKKGKDDRMKRRR